MVPPKTSARKVCMDVCETKAQSSEPVPSASAIRDTDTRKTWRADGPAGRRPPDAVAVWLGWRDGATSYQAFARMSECMSGLHFDQIEGHFPLLFFPIRAKKREIFQCFYESSYSLTINWASKQIPVCCSQCQNMFLTLNTTRRGEILLCAKSESLGCNLNMYS